MAVTPVYNAGRDVSWAISAEGVLVGLVSGHAFVDLPRFGLVEYISESRFSVGDAGAVSVS